MLLSGSLAASQCHGQAAQSPCGAMEVRRNLRDGRQEAIVMRRTQYDLPDTNDGSSLWSSG